MYNRTDLIYGIIFIAIGIIIFITALLFEPLISSYHLVFVIFQVITLIFVIEGIVGIIASFILQKKRIIPRMKTQPVILGIVAILVAVGLSGCQSTDNKLVGVWKGAGPCSPTTLHFYSNGSLCSITSDEDNLYYLWYKYNISGNKLVETRLGYTFTYEFTISDNSQKLTLYGEGDECIYVR